MPIEGYLIILIVTLAAFYFVVPVAVGTFMKYRGKRVITCPETRTPAAIEVDASHAALTAAISHSDLRLKACSRWPERDDCGQECLLQVELSPADCLVRNILTNWYDNKHCVSCQMKFGKISWSDHKPALLSLEGKPVAWHELKSEDVPHALATHFPLCWDCFITESFCRSHPEMLVDRSRVAARIQRGSQV